MEKRLLLISNSISHGQGYLDHVASEIVDFLDEVKSILFIPYALYDRDSYTTIARDRFKKMGIVLTSIHKTHSLKQAVAKAQAIFVGGGNTFRLLDELYRKDLLKIICKRVQSDIPYIGASAGANVACPTIKTTNDMPIVYPPTFDALNLVPFQINPHYIERDSNSKHMGERRGQRIKEFHEENNAVVVGLREGSWIRVEGTDAMLKGKTGAKLFQKGKEPSELKSGTKLDSLLKVAR